MDRIRADRPVARSPCCWVERPRPWPQTDYRNLDDAPSGVHRGRLPARAPRLRAARPLSLRAGAAGNDAHTCLARARVRRPRQPQVGIEAAARRARPGCGDRLGTRRARAFALYNFNTESPGLPALSLRADVSLPVGALAGDVARLSCRPSRPARWGRTRLHLNAARSFGSEDDRRRWTRRRAGATALRADRTLFRQSLLFVGETAAPAGRAARRSK